MIVQLHVWRVRPRAVPAMLWSMAVDRRKIRKNVHFAKLLGTGRGSEFGVGAADLTRWAALVVSETPVQPPMRGAISSCTITLEPIASRGAWAGSSPFSPRTREDRVSGAAGATGANGHGDVRGSEGALAGALGQDGADAGAAGTRGTGVRGDARGGVVAVLTRARLRPSRAVAFWRAIDPVARVLRGAEGLYCAFGVGEAPVGFQGTVSLWRCAADVVRFAYRQPEHAAVVERTARQRWYAEELFARFRVLDIDGDREVIGWRDGQ